MDATRVLLVLPALNEANSVGAVVADCQTGLPGATVLVVDDGSTDGTGTAGRAAGAVVVRHPFNLGVGAAVRSGMQYALANGFEAVVQVDADGQHPASSLPSLLSALDAGVDIAVGSRFMSDDDYQVSTARGTAMGLLRRFVARRTGTSLPDVTSGLRAHGPRSIAVLADCYPAAYLSDTIESLVIAADAGLRIEAVPVAMRERQHGTASHGPWKSAAYLTRVVVLIASLWGRGPHRSQTTSEPNP